MTVAHTIEIISSLCVSRVTLRFMHSKVTDGVMTEPIPIRGGESKSLQLFLSGNDAGVLRAKSRNEGWGYRGSFCEAK